MMNNSGSWSNSKTLVLQTKDSGAIPDGSTPVRRSLVVQRQQRLAYNQNTTVRVRPRLLRQFAQVLPIGRAARLKIAWLRVRVPPWASRRTWLGRQSADHLRLERGMLWVRVPPELFSTNTSSRSSPECSPPCQGGDRGFKSHRGRLWLGRQLADHLGSNPGMLWVRLPPELLNAISNASAGHWRAQVAVTHPPSGIGGSTPSRRTD